ncbi:hypothetical protein [Stieleria varia]|uniref:Uncharacterized protein n=1 Tax=Stieleria varia TaxID=2528005 RepID=A0A5C5ZXM8_9BACT|nr:hypothetical protein [Stieleria varia]TWT92412.1 hypothetical protein Pla52n_62860 [Stieleria varia]
MSNPYAPPTETVETSQRATLPEVAKPIFLIWEKLRLIYIAVLGMITAGALVMHQISTPVTGKEMQEALGAVLFGAIFANLCYFAGPVIETYITWLGYRGLALRWALFITGTAFAGLLALVTIGFTLSPF